MAVNTLSKVLKYITWAVLEEPLAGQLGVGALHALAGHGGRGGKQGLGVGNGPLDLLPQGGGLAG